MEEKISNIDLLFNDKNIINEDNSYEVEENNELKNPKIIRPIKKPNKFPFIFYFFIFVLLLLIGFCCFFLVQFYLRTEEHLYDAFNNPFETPKVTKHVYKKIIFDNGLELLLVQVDGNDTAGGAIVIDSGYNDQTYKKGYLKFALYSLIHPHNISSSKLSDYFGEFNYYINDCYSNFRFKILNDGFFDYLKNFSSILNVDYQKINLNIDNIGKEMENDYESENKTMEKKEQYLIDYLIYGYNESDKDFYRPGKKDDITNITNENITNLLNKLIKPSKIKIVLISHFKMSKMESKFKNYFHYLIVSKKNETNEFIYNNTFTKQKIISYIHNGKSFIKINYYIDKIDNESYSDLIINAGYFNYLKYILDENKDALYGNLNKTNLYFKSISTDFEVILKSKIKFSIKIELYKDTSHFQDFLFNIYNYINRITKYIESLTVADERYKEIKKILNQSFIFQEDSDNPTEISYNFALDLFRKKANESFYFLKDKWIPPLDNEIDLHKFKEYYKQLTPENSVIIFGLNGKENYNETCDSEHKIKLNCDNLILDKSNWSKTTNFNLSYTMDDLDINFTNNFSDINEISFEKNEYISKYEDLITKDPEDEDNKEVAKRIGNKTSNMRNFYFKKDTSFGIPKVHVSLNFFHPFLKPGDYLEGNNLIYNNTEITKQCNYFLIMLYWTYIKKKIINENLYDAIKAGNNISIYYTDNNLYIEIFAYSDQIEKIMNIIKNIIMNTTNIENEFKNKLKLYNESLFEDYLNFESVNYPTITLFYFFNNLVNGKMYDKYKFVQEFNETIYDICISKSYFDSNINNFIINAQIYGNYTKEGVEEIVGLFNEGEKDEFLFNHTLGLAGYDKKYYTLGAYNFVNWTRNINELNESKEIRIDKILLKDGDDKTLIRYFYYDKYTLENYIKILLLSKTLAGRDNRYSGFSLTTEEILRNATYLRFTLKTPDNESYNDFSKFKEILINILENVKLKYHQTIDVVGDRFYYLQKNLENFLIVKRDNMQKKALYYLNSLVYTPNEENETTTYLMKKIGLDGLINELRDKVSSTNMKTIDFLP